MRMRIQQKRKEGRPQRAGILYGRGEYLEETTETSSSKGPNTDKSATLIKGNDDTTIAKQQNVMRKPNEKGENELLIEQRKSTSLQSVAQKEKQVSGGKGYVVGKHGRVNLKRKSK